MDIIREKEIRIYEILKRGDEESMNKEVEDWEYRTNGASIDLDIIQIMSERGWEVGRKVYKVLSRCSNNRYAMRRVMVRAYIKNDMKTYEMIMEALWFREELLGCSNLLVMSDILGRMGDEEVKKSRKRYEEIKRYHKQCGDMEELMEMKGAGVAKFYIYMKMIERKTKEIERDKKIITVYFEILERMNIGGENLCRMYEKENEGCELRKMGKRKKVTISEMNEGMKRFNEGVEGVRGFIKMYGEEMKEEMYKGKLKKKSERLMKEMREIKKEHEEEKEESEEKKEIKGNWRELYEGFKIYKAIEEIEISRKKMYEIMMEVCEK